MKFSRVFFHRAVTALVAASLSLSPSLTLYAQSSLPTLGDDVALTLGAERRFGDQIGREIYRDPEYVSDPVLDAYLQSIWQPLYLAAKQNGALSPEMDEQFAWHLFLVRDRSINAFALPGAYFGVHLGLMGLVDTPDELASVLAHELTHVTQRHIARGMGIQSAQAPLLVGSILLGLLAMRTNPQAANAVLATGQAGAIQGQLNYTRAFEREADRIGFTLMQPAGYAPSGFVAMFNKLGNAARLNDNGSFPYLRSHPLTTERISDMAARVGEFARSQSRPQSTDAQDAALLHRLMSARARVLADLSVDTQKRYAANPANEDPVLLYTAALAAWQLKDTVRAHALYARLQAALPTSAAPAIMQTIRWLGAELQLPVALDLRSELRPEMFYAVIQSMTQAAALPAASSRLRDWLAVHPKDAEAWAWQSRVQLAQGLRVRATMSEAESLRAQLDEPAALARYQIAQSFIRKGEAADAIDAAIVDSKVRELQSLVRDTSRKPGR